MLVFAFRVIVASGLRWPTGTSAFPGLHYCFYQQAERAGETVLAVRMLALLRDASMAPRTRFSLVISGFSLWFFSSVS